MTTSLISKAYNLFTSPKTAVGAFACGVVAHLADNKTVSKVAFAATAISALGYVYKKWTTQSEQPQTPSTATSTSAPAATKPAPQPANKPPAAPVAAQPPIPITTGQPKAVVPSSQIDTAETVLIGKLELVCTKNSPRHTYIIGESRDERAFQPTARREGKNIFVNCPEYSSRNVQGSCRDLVKAYKTALQKAHSEQLRNVAFSKPLASSEFAPSADDDQKTATIEFQPLLSLVALSQAVTELKPPFSTSFSSIRVELPDVKTRQILKQLLQNPHHPYRGSVVPINA